jgi:hypothetical protein
MTQSGVDASGFADIAARVFAARHVEPDLDHLELDLPSVQSAIDELRVRVTEQAETTFDSLVAHCTRRVEIAAYFLALLEMARWGLVELAQDDWLADIEVRRGRGDAASSSPNGRSDGDGAALEAILFVTEIPDPDDRTGRALGDVAGFGRTELQQLRTALDERGSG